MPIDPVTPNGSNPTPSNPTAVIGSGVAPVGANPVPILAAGSGAVAANPSPITPVGSNPVASVPSPVVSAGVAPVGANPQSALVRTAPYLRLIGVVEVDDGNGGFVTYNLNPAYMRQVGPYSYTTDGSEHPSTGLVNGETSTCYRDESGTWQLALWVDGSTYVDFTSAQVNVGIEQVTTWVGGSLMTAILDQDLLSLPTTTPLPPANPIPIIAAGSTTPPANPQPVIP